MDFETIQWMFSMGWYSDDDIRTYVSYGVLTDAQADQIINPQSATDQQSQSQASNN